MSLGSEAFGAAGLAAPLVKLQSVSIWLPYSHQRYILVPHGSEEARLGVMIVQRRTSLGTRWVTGSLEHLEVSETLGSRGLQLIST